MTEEERERLSAIMMSEYLRLESEKEAIEEQEVLSKGDKQKIKEINRNISFLRKKHKDLFK